jgi:ribosomal protein S7
MESNDLRHSWRHLAEKAAQEEDPKKVMELAKELIRAFDEQQSSRPRKSSDLARP